PATLVLSMNIGDYKWITGNRDIVSRKYSRIVTKMHKFKVRCYHFCLLAVRIKKEVLLLWVPDRWVVTTPVRRSIDQILPGRYQYCVCSIYRIISTPATSNDPRWHLELLIWVYVYDNVTGPLCLRAMNNLSIAKETS